VRDHDGVGAAFAKSVEAHGEIDILVSGAAGNFVAPFNGFPTMASAL
jgi:NAD(P)-dependent dehydrogenase (short-subunit alcohol dehydrogenase family)